MFKSYVLIYVCTVCMNGRVEVLITSYWGEGHKKDRASSDKTSMSPAE